MIILASLLSSAVTACAVDDDAPAGAEDGELDSPFDGKSDAWGIASDSYLADAVVRFASRASQAELRAAGVHARAARAVPAATRPFASLAALDAVPYTGAAFFSALAAKVTADGLVGSCGDLVVQTLAGETCDGGAACGSDCLAPTEVVYVATLEPVVGMVEVGDDLLGVVTSLNSYACTLRGFGPGPAELRAMGVPCGGLRPWPAEQVALTQGSERTVTAIDLRTGARREHGSGNDQPLVWATDDLLVTSRDGVTSFLDRVSGDAIATRPLTRAVGVEPDGAIVAVETQANTIVRLRLDQDDQLQRTVLGPFRSVDGATERAAEIRVTRTGVVLARYVAGRTTLTTYAAGRAAPVSTVTVGPFARPVDFIASNGTTVRRESTDHVIEDVAGRRLGVVRCPVQQAPALVAETAAGLLLSTPNCGRDGFYRARK